MSTNPQNILNISKNGEWNSVPLESLHLLTGAKFSSYLEFSSLSLLRNSKIDASQESIWLGKYFEQELLKQTLPFVSLRWIDDRMGWGVFAEKSFQSNEFIAEYTGIVRRRRKSDRTNAYCFEYVLDDCLIDAQDQGGLSRYINHSDTPNLNSALATLSDIHHVILHTNRPIQKGEELSYDYGPDYWRHRKK